jgi:3-hydroxymyristoyl/3-hydroxydecanoyl-(acyl carrier protein) dehydratase
VIPVGVVETVLTVARDHPAYEGHFPGRPILPGVVMLAEVLAAIEAATSVPAERWEIANAKFLEPVLPGAPLTLVHEATGSGRVRFEVRSANAVVASGTLARRDP